jgi:hypothetical protein
MAKTNQIAGFIKSPNGLARPPVRGPQTKPTGLYLLELRSHHAVAQSPLPRRKLVISINVAESSNATPKTIKIFHT